jgi:hypothetical protein
VTAYQFLGTVFAAAVHVNPPTKVADFNFYEGPVGFGAASLVGSCTGVPGGLSCARGWFATLSPYISVGERSHPSGRWPSPCACAEGPLGRPAGRQPQPRPPSPEGAEGI